MNEQIIKERRRTPWLILAGGLIVGLMIGAFLFLPKPLSRQNVTGAVNSDSASFTTLQPAANPGSAGEVVVGQPAPDFTLKTLAGEQVSLSQFRGRPVLINFWASWCPPCRLEMPDLVRAYETHKKDDFVILAIDLTFQDSIEGAQRFADEFNMTFPVLLDETGEVTTDLYQLRGLPMSVFVDREGLVNRVYLGAMTGGQIDEFVGEILEK